MKTLETHSARILVVDDHPNTATTLARAISQLGSHVEVITATSGREALEKVADGAVDILITDMIMPEMNGRALAQLIRDIKPGLKCLFTSGYTADVIAHRGVLDEGVRFIQKPFSMKDLSVKVREVLDNK